MSRSEGRTGEYERDERARDLHVDRYVSESDRIGSAVLPAPLEFERGRPGLRSLFESRERESESATVSPPDNLGCLPERMTRLAHSASPSAWSTTPRLRILDMAHGILSLTPPCIARAHGTHPGSRRQHVRGVSSTRAPHRFTRRIRGEDGQLAVPGWFPEARGSRPTGHAHSPPVRRLHRRGHRRRPVHRPRPNPRVVHRSVPRQLRAR